MIMRHYLFTLNLRAFSSQVGAALLWVQTNRSLLFAQSSNFSSLSTTASSIPERYNCSDPCAKLLQYRYRHHFHKSRPCEAHTDKSWAVSPSVRVASAPKLRTGQKCLHSALSVYWYCTPPASRSFPWQNIAKLVLSTSFVFCFFSAR